MGSFWYFWPLLASFGLKKYLIYGSHIGELRSNSFVNIKINKKRHFLGHDPGKRIKKKVGQYLSWSLQGSCTNAPTGGLVKHLGTYGSHIGELRSNSFVNIITNKKRHFLGHDSGKKIKKNVGQYLSWSLQGSCTNTPTGDLAKLGEAGLYWATL